MSHSADPWITGASLAPVEHPDVMHAALVDLLARYATKLQLMRTDAMGHKLDARDVADFLADTEQVARALRRCVETPIPVAPVDEALRTAAITSLRQSGDAPRPTVNNESGKPLPDLRGYFSASGAGAPPPIEQPDNR